MLNRMRSWVRNFFGFSHTETNAFLIMLPLMAILSFSAPLYRWWLNSQPPDQVTDKVRLDSLVATWKWEDPDPQPVKTKPALFNFNPNTATLADLKKLGLSERLSQQVIHFIAKGGKFKIKHDFGKMYKMDSSTFAELYPFIDLPEKVSPRPPLLKAAFSRQILPAQFDINTADTSQLIKIYGIGSKLSLRITAYRDRLGGFVSLDQLKEIYGLDSAVVHRLKKQAFIRDEFIPRQTNINTAGEKELSSLPYIRFALAKSIAVYRFQHGEFDSVEGLNKIALMDELTFQKIKPYITVKD